MHCFLTFSCMSGTRVTCLNIWRTFPSTFNMLHISATMKTGSCLFFHSCCFLQNVKLNVLSFESRYIDNIEPSSSRHLTWILCLLIEIGSSACSAQRCFCIFTMSVCVTALFILFECLFIWSSQMSSLLMSFRSQALMSSRSWHLYIIKKKMNRR